MAAVTVQVDTGHNPLSRSKVYTSLTAGEQDSWADTPFDPSLRGSPAGPAFHSTLCLHLPSLLSGDGGSHCTCQALRVAPGKFVLPPPMPNNPMTGVHKRADCVIVVDPEFPRRLKKTGETRLIISRERNCLTLSTRVGFIVTASISCDSPLGDRVPPSTINARNQFHAPWTPLARTLLLLAIVSHSCREL